MSRLSKIPFLFVTACLLALADPIIFDRLPAQAQSSQCSVTFLPNTLRNSATFTDGRSTIALIRQSRSNGSPTFDVLLNGRLLGTGVTPFVLVPNRFSVQFRLRLRTNPFTGRVEQELAAAAVTCPPWRRR